jgi:hypothetical protein
VSSRAAVWVSKGAPLQGKAANAMTSVYRAATLPCGAEPRREQPACRRSFVATNAGGLDFQGCTMQCTDKIPHKTKAIAKKAAKMQKRCRGFKLWPYLCSTCGNWHLTKMRQKRAQAAEYLR